MHVVDQEKVQMCKAVFDSNGNVVPYEIQTFTVAECKESFVDKFSTSVTRNLNWKKYLLYLNDLQNYLLDPFTQWIDGSFSTNKLNPDDIDLVNFINYTNFNPDLKMFDMNGSNGYPKHIYNIDGYNLLTFPDTHPYYDNMQERIKYWRTWFGTDRQNNPKGIIEVVHAAYPKTK